MINELIKFANHLDDMGLYKEASYLDEIIKNAGRADVLDAYRSSVMPGDMPGVNDIDVSSALKDLLANPALADYSEQLTEFISCVAKNQLPPGYNPEAPRVTEEILSVCADSAGFTGLANITVVQLAKRLLNL